MRVLITHQGFTEYGGAEKFLESIATLFPGADIFCMVANPDAIPESLRGRKIITSFMDRIPGGKRLYQYLTFLGPLAVESFNAGQYDLVFSSDGTFTKGVLTADDAVHLCYCHSPHRSLWDRYSEYQQKLPWLVRIIFTLSSHYLRLWDFNAAQRVDVYLANSEHIRKRIWKYYRRDSVVVFSPSANIEKGFIGSEFDDYYLSVSRLDSVKRVDLLIEACKRLQRKLIVVGRGPEEQYLRSIAGESVEFRSWVSSEELATLYSRCRAVLFASYEDLGLVPIEAQSYGRPVVAYGKGGALETVIPGVGGVLFPEQTVESVTNGILEFEKAESSFSPVKIRESVMRFSTGAVMKHFQAVINDALVKAGKPPIDF